MGHGEFFGDGFTGNVYVTDEQSLNVYYKTAWIRLYYVVQ